MTQDVPTSVTARITCNILHPLLHVFQVARRDVISDAAWPSVQTQELEKLVEMLKSDLASVMRVTNTLLTDQNVLKDDCKKALALSEAWKDKYTKLRPSAKNGKPRVQKAVEEKDQCVTRFVKVKNELKAEKDKTLKKDAESKGKVDKISTERDAWKSKCKVLVNACDTLKKVVDLSRAGLA